MTTMEDNRKTPRSLNEERVCKKCKQKVISAYVVCAVCPRMKKQSENQMLCDKFKDLATGNASNRCGSVVATLKSENVAFKKEINLLKAQLQEQGSL